LGRAKGMVRRSVCICSLPWHTVAVSVECSCLSVVWCAVCAAGGARWMRQDELGQVPPGAMAPAYRFVRVCLVRIYMCMHVCVCLYACAHWCLLGLWRLHAGACVYVRVCMCMHVCVFICMCTLVPPGAMAPAYRLECVCVLCVFICASTCVSLHGCAHWCLLGLWRLHTAGFAYVRVCMCMHASVYMDVHIGAFLGYGACMQVCVCVLCVLICASTCVFLHGCAHWCLLGLWSLHAGACMCLCAFVCACKHVCIRASAFRCLLGRLQAGVCVCLYLYVRRVCGHAHECLSTRVRVCVHAQQCLQVTRVSHAHRCWSVHVYTQRCAYNALNAQCCVWQCEEIVALSLCLQHYSSQISGPWHGCPH